MEVEETKKMATNSSDFEPFSSRAFRKSLWSDTEVINAMQQFVKRSKNRCREDVILEFLKESASSDSMDLTRLLGEKLSLPQMTVVFNCLEAIFLRISDGLQNQYSQWTELVVGQLLQRGPVHNFLRCLMPTNLASAIVSALRLLTSMVTVSPSSARTITTSIKISSDHLHALLERSSRSVLLGESVRSATIVYLMSLLMIGDSSLIRQYVDQNGALNAIFPSLNADNAPTIQLFLSTLLSTVVKNSSISKTSKIRLFSFKNLKIVLKLFQWKRQKQKVINKKHSLTEAEEEALRISSAEEGQTEEEKLVHETAFHFLESVCCSTDDGILFVDRKYGTSGENKNSEITKLLLAHDKPYDDPLVVKLFVSIVSASPDQLVHYLPLLYKHLVVRPSDTWIRSITYVRRVFEAQRPMEVLKLAEQKSECVKLVHIALMVTTTSMLNKDQLNKILSNEEIAVRHQGLLFLSTVLERARCLLDIGNPELRTLFVKEVDIRAFVKLYTIELLKKLPAFHHLVKCWDLAFPSKKKVSNNEKQATMISSQIAGGQIAIAEHVEAIVNTADRCLCVNEASLDQLGDFLTKNLLADFATLEEKLKDHDKVVEIQLTTLRLLSRANIGEHVLSKTVANRSIVSVVCDIAGRQKYHLSVRSAAGKLLRTLLFSTKIFRGVEHEIDIWIKGFQDSNEAEMTDFLSAVLDDLVRDQDVVREDSGKQRRLVSAGSKKKPHSVVGGYDQLFNDVLNEDVVEDNLNKPELIMETDDVVQDVLRFSPMVSAALRRLKSSTPQCRKFVSHIFTDILHCQHNPRALCELLMQHEHVLPKKCVKYIGFFNSDVAVKTSGKWKKILDKRDPSSLFREAFQTRSAPTLPEATLMDLLKEMDSTDTLCLPSRQLLTYLQVIVPESPLELVAFFCAVLKILVTSSENGLEIGNLVLSHPVVASSFLNDDMLAGECSAYEALTQLALQTVSHVGASHLLVRFMERVEKFIYKKLRSFKDGQFSRSGISFVNLLTPFEDELAATTLREFVSFVSSNFAPADLLGKNKKCLNDTGLFLARIVKIIARTSDQLILAADHVVTLANIHRDVSRLVAAHCCDEEDCAKSDCFSGELFGLFENIPAYSLAVDSEYLMFCLEDAKASINIKIADLLMRHNIANHALFEEWLFTLSRNWREQPSPYASVVSRYLKQVFIRFQDGGSDETSAVILRKLSKTYWMPMSDAILLENDEIAANVVQSLTELETISSKKRVAFCNRFAESADSGKSFSVSSLEVFRVVLSTLTKDDLDEVDPSVLFIQVCLRMMMTLQKNGYLDMWNQDQGGLLQLVSQMLKLNERRSGLCASLQESKLLKSVIRASLKAGLRDDRGTAALEFLMTLLECLRFNDEFDALQSSLVYEMVFGHSNFLPQILAVTPSSTSDIFKWKLAILDLLVFLVQTNPAVCKAVHVPILLAAYDGFLRSTDERLLRLLYLYESNGVDMHSYRPFVWGRSAVHHYSVLNHLENSLWKQPKMEEILGLLDKEIMLRTALHFPLDMDLQVEKYISDGDYQVTSKKDLIYDPRFLLPLFSHLLSPESLVQCTRFIDCNGLAVAFASLGSFDDSTRATGCYILSCFRDHLEGGHKFRNSLIWIYLLDIVRNALDGDSSRKPVPPMMTVFLTRTCQLLQFPTSAVAQPVFNYLFVRPHLDLQTVPEFYVLFSNSEVKHNIIRYWILDVLTDGLRTKADFKLCQKRLVFKIVLSFFESPLSNQQCKCKILGVLNAATKITSVAVHLVNRQGILAFLISAVRDFGDNKEIVAEIIDIVSSAWTSVNRWNRDDVSSTMKTEFLLVLVRILDFLNASTVALTIGIFLKIVASVLSKWDYYGETNAPGVTTSLVKKLLDAHGLITEVSEQSLVTGDQVAINEVHTAIYEILMSWRSRPTVTKKLSTNYGDVFVTSLDVLLKMFPACAENYTRLLRIYSWLSGHLQCDSSGSLTRRISISGGDVTTHLFKSYEHLLFAAGDHDRATVEKSSVAPGDVLAALNSSVVALANHWSRAKTTTDERVANSFVELLNRIGELSREPAFQETINLLTSDDACQRRFAAVSFGILVSELWIRKRDPIHFQRFLKSRLDKCGFEDKDIGPSVGSISVVAKRKSGSSVDVPSVKRRR